MASTTTESFCYCPGDARALPGGDWGAWEAVSLDLFAG